MTTSSAWPLVGGQPLPCGVFLASPNEVAEPDFELFRQTLNGHFYPADVRALGGARLMRDPRISAVRLSMTTLGYVRFGADAVVEPGILPAYHVNVALSGSVVSHCGAQEAIASPQMATVFSPGHFTSLPRWDAQAAQLSIKLGRTQVEAELSHLLGRPVVGPIDFKLGFPLDGDEGARWLSILAALLHALQGEPGGARTRHVELMERSLIAGLLLSQPHSFSDELAGGVTRPVSATSIDRVLDAIDQAPDRGYTVAALADLAGVSARSLQYAFQERFGTTPMRYLRKVRLDRAQADLTQANGSVAEIAYHWGFTNLGRFAQAYRERFGELPGTTLENARGVYDRHA